MHDTYLLQYYPSHPLTCGTKLHQIILIDALSLCHNNDDQHNLLLDKHYLCICRYANYLTADSL